MSSLRQAVADAIMRDQAAGGAGIFTDEENAAVERMTEVLFLIQTGALTLNRQYAQEHPHMANKVAAVIGDAESLRDTFIILSCDLGNAKVHIQWTDGAKQRQRQDKYWMQCADVAIEAYDRWMDSRKGSARAY